MIPELTTQRNRAPLPLSCGTDGAARSPSRRRYEWPLDRALDAEALQEEAAALTESIRFAHLPSRHTALIDDHHRCIIQQAA
jgi:hypothetical protein